MRVTNIAIDYYRSIEHIEINFPEGKPLVLFGPNNAGKSNIISAVNRMLGERFAPYIDMADSDFFLCEIKTSIRMLIFHVNLMCHIIFHAMRHRLAGLVLNIIKIQVRTAI